jgi:hypothetical protein
MSAENDFEALKASIEKKIQGIVEEFSRGEISREQFNVLYQRYNNRLNIAMSAHQDDDIDPIESAGIPTEVIRGATMGKAIGLAIYHHSSGTTLETLGNYDLPPNVVTAVLNDLSGKLEEREFTEPVIRDLSDGLWVVFITRKFTTAIVVFRNEPSRQQIGALQRMLHDFEEANLNQLERPNIQSDKLAQPFTAIVRKSK